MKKYTHAWLALQAVGLLKRFKGGFSKERNRSLDRFLAFIGTHQNTFVRGAWFPDTVVKDNTQGGHTWKYRADEQAGIKPKRKAPDHVLCRQFVADRLDAKLVLDERISDLPDRCESLSQMIRDCVLITNKMKKGDILGFNNSQIAVMFLMLAHYICDAHVPVHCDARDLYNPSKVHPDLEAFWEKEITKFYTVSKKAEQFDLDPDGNLQRKANKTGYDMSFLHEFDQILDQYRWKNMTDAKPHWRAFLGAGNKNFWDYIVSVCVVSFHMSQLMFPPDADVDYDTLRIMQTEPFKTQVIRYSPFILADAVNSTALLWLAAWERWELLAAGVR